MTDRTANSPLAAGTRNAAPGAWSDRRLFRWAGLIVVLASAAYFLFHATEQWRVFPEALSSARAAIWIGPLLAVYFTSATVSGYAWHRLLRATGEATRLRPVLAILLVTQIAKYVPGNVAQHIGRIGLARAAGYGTARVVATLAIETVLVIAVAGLIAISVLAAGGPGWLAGTPIGDGVRPPILILTGLAGGLLVLAGMPWFKRRVPDLWHRLSRGAPVGRPGGGVLLLCALFYAANFLAIGICLDLLALQVFEAGQSHLARLIGVYAVAWVLGFLMPGAPAGLGVREAVLLAALGPIYGTATAVGLSVALRIVTALGDGLLFLAGLALRPARGPAA